MTLPAAWRSLHHSQRDLLLSLVSDGPMSGADLYERVGGVDGHRGKMSTYRHLSKLVDGGYVSERAVDGRTSEYAPTDRGRNLVTEYVSALRRLHLDAPAPADAGG